MSLNFLEFEKPIAELEAKIEALRDVSLTAVILQLTLIKKSNSLRKRA